MRREDSIALADSLDLPEPIRRVVRGEPLSDRLRLFFGFPEEFLLASDEERAAWGWAGIVPLWDDGNFDEVVGYWPEAGAFVRFRVEEHFDLSTAPRYNWQQVILPDFISMYEFEMPDDEFRELAKTFRFEYAEEVISAYQSKDLSTFEKHQAWLADLEQRMGEGRPTTG